jgi:DNA-binding transcriptional LysR family regulator
MDKWTELRTASYVARLGTVSAAADALGFHRATVNRHIDLLEGELGAPIFIRHARGYTLTELGHDTLRVAQKTEILINDLAGRAAADKSHLDGEIKITTLAPFAPLLMPALIVFRTQNPQCRVDIKASEDLARLEYGEAHIALRAGPKPEHPDYVVTHFARLQVRMYAHDNYIAKYGVPESDANLTGHHFVAPTERTTGVPYGSWIDAHIKPEMLALSSRDNRVNFDAICSGLGIGFLAEYEASECPQLQPVLKSNEAWAAQLWLVTHVDLHRTEKVQAMLNCIKSAKNTYSNL